MDFKASEEKKEYASLHAIVGGLKHVYNWFNQATEVKYNSTDAIFDKMTLTQKKEMYNEGAPTKGDGESAKVHQYKMDLYKLCHKEIHEVPKVHKTQYQPTLESIRNRPKTAVSAPPPAITTIPDTAPATDKTTDKTTDEDLSTTDIATKAAKGQTIYSDYLRMIETAAKEKFPMGRAYDFVLAAKQAGMISDVRKENSLEAEVKADLNAVGLKIEEFNEEILNERRKINALISLLNIKRSTQ
jgi:hypothetical protein